MLVFQKNFDHILERCKRAEIEPKWLVELVEEINYYLPDDWRLTRSSNNFSIQIVADSNVKLQGHSYRIEDNKILHIIDTIFLKQYFDKYDLQAATGQAQGRVNKCLKKEYPEILVPNLYFFRFCPENSISPLFARQYEKIKQVKHGNAYQQSGDQYHRIHPLTKAGLDLEHFRWIRWTINGDVELVNTIDPQYHGKDYWQIEELKGTKNRGHLKDYLDSYKAVKTSYQVKSCEEVIKSPTLYETEYKFLVPGNEAEAHNILSSVEQAIEASDFTICQDISKKKAKEQVDTYFDDDNLTLHAVGASFRIRRSRDNIRATLKKRLPVQNLYSKEGLYERIEEEAVITTEQVAALFDGNPINALPYRLLQYIAPYYGKLNPMVKVINHRRTLFLEDSGHRKVEICFDKVSYEISSERLGPYFELEIESKGAARHKVRELANYIEEMHGLIVSGQSKYERGISLMKTAHIQKEKKLVILDTDCGVDDALALVLALRSPELDVKAITTVSGNVHVDKVIPNVFKVLRALKIDTPPLVAKGADSPLKKELSVADSVHGEDGLGDVIPLPEDIRIDYRFAWQVICDLARQYPKQITLITIGPMTNLALAIQNDPEGVRCLKEVVAMGGVFFEVGNVGADAEFNVATDPDAAYEVVRFCRDSCLKTPIDNDGNEVILTENSTQADYKKIKNYQEHGHYDPKCVPMTFIGLDVTHKVVLRRAALKRAVKAHSDNALLRFIKDISKKYMDFYEGNEGVPGCYLHDPLAVAYVINPTFLEIVKHIIRVETRGQFTSGVIFPDDRPTRNPAWRNPAEEVVGIAHHVEREAFEEFFMRRMIEEE
jgi:inosine-uridine nucleoside N-ribohydrolase